VRRSKVLVTDLPSFPFLGVCLGVLLRQHKHRPLLAVTSYVRVFAISLPNSDGKTGQNETFVPCWKDGGILLSPFMDGFLSLVPFFPLCLNLELGGM